MRGRVGSLVFLVCEDVEAYNMDPLAFIGGRHIDNFAGAAVDYDEAVLAQSRALYREGERCASISGLEGNVVL